VCILIFSKSMAGRSNAGFAILPISQARDQGAQKLQGAVRSGSEVAVEPEFDLKTIFLVVHLIAGRPALDAGYRSGQSTREKEPSYTNSWRKWTAATSRKLSCTSRLPATNSGRKARARREVSVTIFKEVLPLGQDLRDKNV